MRRVVIVGNAGAGKSMLAREVGQRLNLPIHHLDALFWKPGWVESERAAFTAQVDALAAGDRWVTEGNYSRTFPARFRRADTVVWVDLPRTICTRRIFARAFEWRGRTRPDMAPNCPEELPDLKFLRYIWTFPYTIGPKITKAMAAHGEHARLLRLRREHDVAAFVADL